MDPGPSEPTTGCTDLHGVRQLEEIHRALLAAVEVGELRLDHPFHIVHAECGVEPLVFFPICSQSDKASLPIAAVVFQQSGSGVMHRHRWANRK